MRARFWLVAATIMVLVGAIHPGVASAARPPTPPPPPLLPLGTPTGQSEPASPSTATAGPNRAANTYYYRSFPSGYGITQMYSTVDVEWVTSYNNGAIYPGRFFAYSFFFTTADRNSKQGYIGLETKLQSCGAVNQGFGAIFSIFGATGASINGGVSNQVCTGVENGLSYYSLHWPFAFNANHDYTMVVARSDATHYDGYVIDGPTWYYLGRITVPSGWGWLSNNSNVQWTENYPNDQTWNGCNYIDKSQAIFRRPWAGDGTSSFYSDNTLDASYIQDDGGASFCTAQSSISGDLGNNARREQVGTLS